jgi:hypothetical protein
VILDTPVEEFAEQVLGQHYILAYGDCKAQLQTLCKLLAIDVV